MSESSASATALFAFSGGLVAGFFQAMNENRFGMLSGPAIWQHLFEPVVVGVHAQEEFTDISPRFQSVPFGAGQDRIQHSRTRTCRLTA